jgi:hypothetical protein
MYSYSYNPKAITPSLLDFVVDPLAIGRCVANQDNCAFFSTHLTRNPLLDRLVTPLFDRLPFVVSDGRVTFDYADVPNLARARIIGHKMKAIKAFADHYCLP